MIHYKPKEYPFPHLDLLEKTYNELLEEIDSRSKNPPQKRLSKKQFYELVKKEPWQLYANVEDETEDRNYGKVIWLPLCEEPLPLEEVMKLRELYEKNYESYLRNRL